MVNKYPKLTAKKLAQNSPRDMSPSTVSRYLQDHDYHSYIARKKLPLEEKHMATRLEWANSHLGFSIDDWKNVIFTDETSIALGSPMVPQHVFRQSSRLIIFVGNKTN